MAPWSDPGDGAIRRTTIDERAALLVDLLDLTDALPPPRRRHLEVPSFRELCGLD